MSDEPLTYTVNRHGYSTPDRSIIRRNERDGDVIRCWTDTGVWDLTVFDGGGHSWEQISSVPNDILGWPITKSTTGEGER